MKLLIFILSFLIQSQWSLACDPIGDSCNYDKEVYNAKIKAVSSEIPENVLSIKQHEGSIEFLSKTNESVYYLREKDRGASPYLLRFNNSSWSILKLKKGKKIGCLLSYEDEIPAITVKTLDSLNWGCSVELDSCGHVSNEQSPIWSANSSLYRRQSIDLTTIKPISKKNYESHAYFLHKQKIKKVTIKWQVVRNRDHLLLNCTEKLKSCGRYCDRIEFSNFSSKTSKEKVYPMQMVFGKYFIEIKFVENSLVKKRMKEKLLPDWTRIKELTKKNIRKRLVSYLGNEVKGKNVPRKIVLAEARNGMLFSDIPTELSVKNK